MNQANRGRGRGGGRGRGRGRNAARLAVEALRAPDHVLAPADDSGEELSEPENIGRVQDNIVVDENEAFPAFERLDGESDDEAENALNQEEDIPIYSRIDVPNNLEDLGPDHRFDHQFNFGMAPNYNPFHKYVTMSPFGIVMFFAGALFSVLLSCFNAFLPPAEQLTMKDIFLYHAYLLFRCIVPLARNEVYWDSPLLMMNWIDEAKKLFGLLTLNRFYAIRRKLKGYKPEDDIPEKTRDWKVKRAVTAVQRTFQSAINAVGEYLSIDEGMARGSSTRNPIYVT